jgi:hypothetical protein
LKEIRQFVVYLREMISNYGRRVFVINSFLEFEQLEYGKQDKSEQKENFYANESPKQDRSSHWLEPKKIFHKKREQEIQQSQTDEENHSSNQFVGVKLLDEKFQFLINKI